MRSVNTEPLQQNSEGEMCIAGRGGALLGTNTYKIVYNFIIRLQLDFNLLISVIVPREIN